jgi:hypothetical protein
MLVGMSDEVPHYRGGVVRVTDFVVHRLKTWPTYFRDVQVGKKCFEVRRADRDFKVGDVLHLEEWDPETQRYTGAVSGVEVTYILYGGQFGVEAGYVVLGVRLLGR